MPRVEIELELTGFKLKIKAEKDDVPGIAANVGSQLAGLMGPAAAMTQGQLPARAAEPIVVSPSPPPAGETANRTAKRSSGGGQRKSVAPSPAAQPLDWKHDPGKWGTPLQKWTTADKAIWLLHVLAAECPSVTAVSSAVVAATFTKHFRQSGAIRPSNVARDLGLQKTKAPPLVGEDTSKSPGGWYLVQEGVKRAEQLVKQGKGLPEQPTEG